MVLPLDELTKSHSIMKAVITISLFLSSIFFTSNLLAQQRPVEVDPLIVATVEKEIWIPFMESYRDLDFQKLKSLHIEDITRVSPKMNQIQSGEPYFKTLKAFFEQIKSLNYQMNIRFSIVTSATSKDKVYQTGYFTIDLKTDKQSAYQSTGYSSFSILAVKSETGTWKIAFDSDQPAKLTEEEFVKAGVVYSLN